MTDTGHEQRLARLGTAIDKDSADYRRIGPNSLWPHIQEDIDRFFGPLAVIARGRLSYDKYLRDCYVREFGAHRDEQAALKSLELVVKEDVTFYSDLQSWVSRKRPYLQGVLGHYSDFNPLDWKDLHYARMLCGRKGSGKTTLLLFTKGDIESKARCYCIFISLSSPGFETDDPVKAIRYEIIHQMEDLVRRRAKTNKMRSKELVLKWHLKLWRRNDAYPNKEDSYLEARRKSKLRDKLLVNLDVAKYEAEFVPYVQRTMELLKKCFDTQLVLIIDDVDRLQCDSTAQSVCDRARNLARKLTSVPVIVSIREETIAKLSDIDSITTRISVIPPSFRRVLQKRLDIFLANFAMNEDKTRRAGYKSEQVKEYITHIAESILAEETYMNLIGFHYDVDILLDVVRCLVRSPFIEPAYVLGMKGSGNIVPWHIILDSMQRFQYKNFYDENSFILNMFDNDECPATWSNALIRVRLLQVLRHRFVALDKPVKVGQIYCDMEQLGYNRGNVVMALRALARHHIVVTWRARNVFEDDIPEVLPKSAIVYYLDSLIWSYRYLQNIVPVTHVSFSVPMDICDVVGPLVGDRLKMVSDVLMQFVDFMKDCEEIERENVKDTDLFDKVTRAESVSRTMRAALRRQISSMKN